jgi:hypothetical protein
MTLRLINVANSFGSTLAVDDVYAPEALGRN